jgi:hypothetical protein
LNNQLDHAGMLGKLAGYNEIIELEYEEMQSE